MKAGLLLLLALLSAFMSCSDKVKTEVKETKLEFKTLFVDSLMIGKATEMLLVDSNLLISDRQSDSLFHWVNLNKLTSKDIGQIGQGPGEFLHFDNFYHINNNYGFYDRRLRTSNDIIFLKDRILLNKNVRYGSIHYRLVPTAFNTFVGIGPYEKGLFHILDIKGIAVDTIGEQPYRDEAERSVPELARAMAYQGKIVTSPKGDYLVHAIFMSPIISFYKLSLANIELLKSHVDCYPTYKPELGNNSYASAMSRSNILGFIDVAVTDRYVYALLSGKSTRESGLSAFAGNVIRVYDWNGNLLKIYTCNTDLTTLCVSADDSIMYAIGLVEDYELLVANLK